MQRTVDAGAVPALEKAAAAVGLLVLEARVAEGEIPEVTDAVVDDFRAGRHQASEAELALLNREIANQATALDAEANPYDSALAEIARRLAESGIDDPLRVAETVLGPDFANYFSLAVRDELRLAAQGGTLYQPDVARGLVDRAVEHVYRVAMGRQL